MKIVEKGGTVTFYPTRTIIEGYNERVPQIEGSLNVWNNVTFSFDFQAYIKNEDTNTIYIPNSFNKNYLKQLLPGFKFVDKRSDCNKAMLNNKTIYPIKMKYDFKDDIQRDAVKFLNQGRSYRDMQKYLCLNTGVGKTYCAVRYIVDNLDRPIIFVDQESLAVQWIERIIEYTDTNKDEIYYISGQKSLDKLMNKSEDEIMKIKFFICCYRTVINNLIKTENSLYLSNLLKHIKVNLKIYDEAHIEWMSIFKLDMICNLRTIYLSATPFRSNPSEDKVYQRIFENVDKFFNLNEKYHTIGVFRWNSKPSLLDISNCTTKYGLSTPKYCNYIMDKKYDEFEEKIYDILFKICLKNRRKRKIAILFGTNALINKFYENIIQYINDMGYNKLKVGIFNGTIKKEDKLKQLEENDIILTTDKSFSKGMDVKNLQFLINTVPFSSESKSIQIIGRLRPIPKKEVFFFDLNDVGIPNIKYQLDSKIKKVFTIKGKNVYDTTL